MAKSGGKGRGGGKGRAGGEAAKATTGGAGHNGPDAETIEDIAKRICNLNADIREVKARYANEVQAIQLDRKEVYDEFKKTHKGAKKLLKIVVARIEKDRAEKEEEDALDVDEKRELDRYQRAVGLLDLEETPLGRAAKGEQAYTDDAPTKGKSARGGKTDADKAAAEANAKALEGMETVGSS